MSDFFNQFSRRKFLLTAGASASAVFLKGCLGNPPESAGGDSGSAQAQLMGQKAAQNLPPEQKPETTKVSLGYIPIVEAAPL
ncbi:MAG: bicarbonate-binding protein, partial [Calothrix sp. SM1_7_51]|nr:bicarbonate-binding protein [Calothrix sp. SM1_7_51]